MSGRRRFVHFLYLSFVGLLALTEVECVQLNPDGGYDLVVGIADEAVFEVPDPIVYVDSVKTMIDKFAALLWSSTRFKFYIKTVQILIPADWSSEFQSRVSLAEISIKATYGQADIQITNSTAVPHTENYHHCGRPGLRIRLPFTFPDSEHADTLYGYQPKGLLNLWLRYRFGVWEEHGYPGHPITSYVYNENDIEHSRWLLTSCTNTPMNGNFQDAAGGEETVACSTNGSVPMLNTCRFVPDVFQGGVRSSVMNFQWVRSVVELCDEYSHNKQAPNRQNLYCGHKSVWEVIRESVDYKTLNNGRDTLKGATREGPVPGIEYKIVIPSPKPLLYILLEVGRTAIWPGDPIYDHWLTKMNSFIEKLPSDVVTSLVAYPNWSGAITYLRPLVNWTLLDSVAKESIKKALDFGIPEVNESVDFRIALAEALSELKTRNHPNGAILLVLRTEDTLPASTNSFSGAFEEEFLLHLKQFGISLYAIEISPLSPEERHTLRYLATESGGLSALIRDGDDPADTMDPVLESVYVTLYRGWLPPRTTDYEVIYKEMLNSFDADSLLVQKSILIPKRSPSDIDTLHIFVTLAYGYGEQLTYFRFQLPDPAECQFIERNEWDQDDTSLHPYSPRTFSKTVNVSSMANHNGSWAWELYMMVDGGNYVHGLVLVYGSRSTAKETGAPSSANTNVIQAEISTSSADSTFSCNGTDLGSEPLAIYVKLRDSSGRPILFQNPHPHQVEPKSGNENPIFSATIMNLNSGFVITTRLDDNGHGADLLAGDGVYSGYIYPANEGLYQIYVSFYDYKVAGAGPVHKIVRPIGRIPSVAQDDLEVNVFGTTLHTPYSIVLESPALLRVTSACYGRRYIPRVLDTTAIVTEADAEIVKIAFTVPEMTTSLDVDFDDNEWEHYYMGIGRFAGNIDTLIDDLGKGEMVVFLVAMAPPGRTASVFLPRERALAFAFELLDYRQSPTKSLPSNIVRIKGWRPDDPSGDDTNSKVEACAIGCILAIGFGTGIPILILAVLSAFLWRRNRAQRAQLAFLSRDEVKEFLHGHLTSKNALNEYLDTSERVQSLPYDSKYEIPADKLHIDKTELLGSGTFGNVYKGYVVDVDLAGDTAGKVLTVAVKTIKPSMDKSNFKALLTEVKLMTHIGSSHPNIIKLVGACTKNIRKCEVFLATEFCANGNLSSYLLTLNESNFRNLIDQDGNLVIQEAEESKQEEIVTTTTLIKWALQIAAGMEFLGEKKIVHGDVAARNILLDSSLVAKVSDFGLSKQMLQNYGSYKEQNTEEVEMESGGLLPWKWLAPEALTFMKFSVASDVWAYGVTIWEIFTLGQVPYPGVKWSPDFVNQLEKGGLRLQKPNYATKKIYDIMLACWVLEPRARIGFDRIRTEFGLECVSPLKL